MKSSKDVVWQEMSKEAQIWSANEPALASYLHATIINHDNLASALSYVLAAKLESSALPALAIRDLVKEAIIDQLEYVREDLHAVHYRDPACDSKLSAFLYFKGFQALQAHRVSHTLWRSGRKPLAMFFQSQISQSFGVDIHPAAQVGCGVMFDHATGIVIGETAVIDDMVSILHSVTLGGTGKTSGDRHPKIGKGVMVGAGAKVLGNISIGACSRIAAGSVVLQSVPEKVVVAGVPATVRGATDCDQPALQMNQAL